MYFLRMLIECGSLVFVGYLNGLEVVGVRYVTFGSEEWFLIVIVPKPQCCQPSRPSDITEDGTGRQLAVRPELERNGAVFFEAGRGRTEGTAVIGRHPLMICESSYIIDIQL